MSYEMSDSYFDQSYHFSLSPLYSYEESHRPFEDYYYLFDGENNKENVQEDLKRINVDPPQNKEVNIIKSEKKNSDKNNFSTFAKTEKNSEEAKEVKTKNIKLGRKRNGESGFHTKFAFDNIIRKIKPILIDTIMKYLNEKISECDKSYLKLAKINQSQASNITVSFNINLLNKSLKDVFSEDITKKCTVIISKYGIDYNKKLINSIYEDNEKNGCYENIIKIFEKKFLEVLEHCRGSKYYDELAGLREKFSEKIETELKNEDEEYKIEFWNILNSLEKEYENRKGRKSKKQKIEEI